MKLNSVVVTLACLFATSSLLAQAPLLEVSGELTKRDPRLSDDSPYDEYTIELNEGEGVSVEMSSYDVDTYLIVTGPQGEEFSNDDFGGSTRLSRVEFIAPSTGTYTIDATCYDPADRGDYELRVDPIESHRGELADGDESEADGRYIDWYEIECPQGQLVMAQVNSDNFDTYLIVEDPHQSRDENDDFDGSTEVSRVEANTFVEGTYRVGVSSYQQGETGEYDLMISRGAGYIPVAVQGSQQLDADFDGTESMVSGNGFVDGYAFEAVAGTTVIIDMTSDDVDTFLKIKGPGGLSEQNDDVAGVTNSRLAFRVDISGTYYITATTFSSDEIGNYSINFDLNASKFEAGDWAVGEHGEVYGVFVGIEEYSDGDSLAYCDDDAERLEHAFRNHFPMANGGSTLLMNDEATVDAILSALEDVVGRAGPDDMVVFFYSGHGGREANENGDPADPDGFDETLAVYDGALLDDRFAEAFENCKARTTLVVLDSCYSGGFARDFVTQKGRVGLFSSEGDCLSMVADDLKSGGYLSRFFLDGITDARDDADHNQDHMLTVHELTFYVQAQFGDVLSRQRRGTPSRLFPAGDIDPGENFGFQRVICDRDAVSPHLILLDWE